jgi:hypothetical protein
MTEEVQDASPAVEDTTEVTQPETTEQETVETPVETPSEEPVDDKGVPLKNREAEMQRKVLKAQRELLTREEPKVEDEAIEIVRRIAREEQQRANEPILVRQFLLENHDAADMIEDINRIRASYPELSGVDKLDLVYKIAKAEKQEEIIRQRVEAEAKAKAEKLAKSTQASVEGSGKGTPSITVTDRIAKATTLDELKALEDQLQR